MREELLGTFRFCGVFFGISSTFHAQEKEARKEKPGKIRVSLREKSL